MFGKHSRIHWPLALVAILACVVLLTACGPSSGGVGDEDPLRKIPTFNASSVKTGGNLRYPSSVAPGGWDMHMRPMYGPYFAMPVFNNLVAFNPLRADIVPENIVGDLAQKFEVSPDGKTYTFNLRQGVKWHDGSAFTADDVEYTIQKMMDPKRSIVTGFFPTYDRVEKVDANTVKVYLKTPAAAFLMQLAGPYAPMQAKAKASVDARTIEFAMGTGPFKLGKVAPGVTYEYTRNADYFKKDASGKALPYLDALTIPIIATADALTEALATGRIDLGQLVGQINSDESLAKFRSLVDMKDYVLTTGPIPARPGPGLWFNFTNNDLKDVRVRKAIALLIDEEQFIIAASGSKFWGNYGIGVMAGNYGMPRAEIAKMLGRDRPYDDRVAEAKKLMADAGKSAGIKVKLSYANYDIHQRRAQFLADVFKKYLNIESTLSPFEPAQSRVEFGKGNFDICIDQLTAVLGDPDEIMTYYMSGTAGNYAKYSNPDVDKLWLQQSQATDPAQRRQLTSQIERQLLTDLPMIPTAGAVSLYSWRNYVNYPMTAMAYGPNYAMEYTWMSK